MTYNPDTAQGIAATALADAGTLALTDLDVINRAGIDYRTNMTQRITLFRKTPAGSRTAALPVTLTASDHDKNVLLTGTAGNLTVDGTVSDGFRCHLINTASGVATYSAITGLLGTTSLASGAVCTVMAIGNTIYATASGNVSVPVATSYTSSLSTSSGTVGSPVALILTPTSGAWPTGETITCSVSGVTGSFSPASFSPASNSSGALTSTFTPSSAGTATISTSTNPAMTNTTGNLIYTANMAVATSYSLTESATSGLVGSPVTLTFTPVGGVWPSSAAITPASTLAGTFSTLTVSAGTTAAATCAFTPSVAGAASISATNNASLSNPSSLGYTAIQLATAYTTAISAATGASGIGVTLTFTPTGGGWPTGEAITPAVSGVPGTFSPATITPAAASTAAVTCVFTPTAAGTATLNSTTSPALTNATGALTYTVTTAPATAYTTALSAPSGLSGTPVSVTFTPSGGGWPTGVTITPMATSLIGSFSPATVTPAGGSTAAVTSSFTPTAGGAGTINATTSPTMTNSSGSQSYTATGAVPSYPAITTTGVNRLAIFDSNAGVSSSGGTVTAVADQSGTSNSLTSSIGAAVGATVNGWPTITFAGQSQAAASGLKSTGSWLAPLNGNMSLAFAFKTGASLPASGAIMWNLEPASYLGYDDYFLLLTASGTLQLVRRCYNRADLQCVVAAGSIVANTLYKLMFRVTNAGNTIEGWLNSQAKVSQTGNSQFAFLNAPSTLSLGQVSTGSFTWGTVTTGNMGLNPGQFLEAHVMQNALSDADIATFQAYLTSKWGS